MKKIYDKNNQIIKVGDKVRTLHGDVGIVRNGKTLVPSAELDVKFYGLHVEHDRGYYQILDFDRSLELIEWGKEMKAKKWNRYPDREPEVESYYEVILEDFTHDEKYYRIRGQVRGWMVEQEQRVIAWRELEK